MGRGILGDRDWDIWKPKETAKKSKEKKCSRCNEVLSTENFKRGGQYFMEFVCDKCFVIARTLWLEIDMR